MKKWIQFVALLTAVTLLAGCNLIGVDTEMDAQQTVAQIGDTKITKAQWHAAREDAVAYYQYMYSMYGMNFNVDASMLETIGKEALESLVQQEVLRQKATALGLDTFTDEELAEMDTQAAETMEQQQLYYQLMYFYDVDPESATVSEAVDARLAQDGITLETVTESVKQQKVLERMREEAIKDVTVSEDEVKADYDQKVESQKTSYDTTPTLYAAAQSNGTQTYYVPEGYRGIKHVLVKIDSAKSSEISSLNTTLSSNATSRASLEKQLEELTAEPAEGEEPTQEETAAKEESIATINAQLAELDASDAEANEALTAAHDEAYGAIRTKAEMVLALAKGDLDTAKTLYAQLEETAQDADATAGEATPDEADKPLDVSALTEPVDFDTLMEEYGEDPGMRNDLYKTTGYAVCEGLTLYETPFQEAAMALENIGDVSELVEGTNGYHILMYAGDIPAGAVEFDSVKDAIEASLLSTKQNEAYNAAVAAWVEEANVKTYPKAMEDVE